MASLPPPLYSLSNHHKLTVTPPNNTTTTRRSSLLYLTPPFLLLLFTPPPSAALDLRLTIPDQTLDEAKSTILPHAKNLLNVKELLLSCSWKEAQKSLRRSAAALKQDVYTIIQSKPAEERQRLRRLYADLFGAVVGMEYAVRDLDTDTVWKLYERIVLYVDDILASV